MFESSQKLISVVIGTRPEAVKMAPIVRALQKRPDEFRCQLISTGQHREMLRQTLSSFGLHPDIDLDLMTPDQTLSQLTARAIVACDNVFLGQKPSAVLVQGDTSTVLSASIAAFYNRIPIGHVEAGLRTFDRYNPFPEEMNRKQVGALANWHFAPTERAVRNLRKEGVQEASIFMTGNTVVDALMQLRLETTSAHVSPSIAAQVKNARGRLILVTCHRRESLDGDLAIFVDALAELASQFSDRVFLFPLHLNPRIQQIIVPRLSGISNIVLSEPLSYVDILHCLSGAELVLTDSGGIQEEAPSFGVPVIVLRRTTERPEGVTAGFSRLVAINKNAIVTLASRWLRTSRKEKLIGRPNPYGDGHAAERIVDLLKGLVR